MAHKKGELTPKQNRFIAEYLKDQNGTQSAIRAGYSKKTAAQIAEQLLRKLEISEKLSRKHAKIIDKLEISAENILRELARLGYSDISLLASWTKNKVTLKPSAKLGENETRCVSEISQTSSITGNNIKIKMHDKVAALEKLAKHVNLFAEKPIAFDPQKEYEFELGAKVVVNEDPSGPGEVEPGAAGISDKSR